MADEFVAAAPEEKAFRVQCKRLMLTYKTHVDKEQLTAFLMSLGAETVHIAHENGTSDPATPYEHTHALVARAKPFVTRDARHFDYEGIHPHVKTIKNDCHWSRGLNYLAKEDPDNAGLRQSSIVDAIWSKPTMADALRSATDYNQIIPITVAYAHKPIEQPEDAGPEQWYPWQEEVLLMVQVKPDDRTIHWYVDKAGGSGKSRLSRYMAINDHALVINNFGRTTDFMTLALNALRTGSWDGRVFIADLPRSAETKNIYEPLEAIKDGHIQTTKYTGVSQFIASPHVLVFANFAPNQAKMSSDRWRIHRMRDDSEMTPRASTSTSRTWKGKERDIEDEETPAGSDD